MWSAGCETFDAVMLHLPVNAHVASLFSLIRSFLTTGAEGGGSLPRVSEDATCNSSHLKLPVKPSFVEDRYSPDGFLLVANQLKGGTLIAWRGLGAHIKPEWKPGNNRNNKT